MSDWRQQEECEKRMWEEDMALQSEAEVEESILKYKEENYVVI